MSKMPDFLPNLDSRKDWSKWKDEQASDLFSVGSVLMLSTSKLARMALMIAAVLLPAGVRANSRSLNRRGLWLSQSGTKPSEKMSGVLKLDADQKGLVRTLYTGYRPATNSWPRPVISRWRPFATKGSD